MFALITVIQTIFHLLNNIDYYFFILVICLSVRYRQDIRFISCSLNNDQKSSNLIDAIQCYTLQSAIIILH